MNRISINGFSLSILSNGMSARKENIHGAYYFLLSHGSQYKLKLFNDHNTKCDAEIWIDDEKIGTWRINSHHDIVIERPSTINRKFVFLKENSCVANLAGINVNRNNGLIKIVFKPEREYMLFNNNFDSNMGQSSFMGLCANNCMPKSSMSIQPLNYQFSNYSHGATALGNKSHQEFDTISPIYDVDSSNITTIMARLIIDESDYECKPLVSLKNTLNTTTYPSRLPANPWSELI